LSKEKASAQWVALTAGSIFHVGAGNHEDIVDAHPRGLAGELDEALLEAELDRLATRDGEW